MYNMHMTLKTTHVYTITMTMYKMHMNFVDIFELSTAASRILYSTVTITMTMYKMHMTL
jgi:hypothetical protein